jgi:hypothetical protein
MFTMSMSRTREGRAKVKAAKLLRRPKTMRRPRRRLSCFLLDAIIPAESISNHSSSGSAHNDLFSTYFHVMLFSFVTCFSVRKSLEVAFSAQLSAISVLSCSLTRNVLIDMVV